MKMLTKYIVSVFDIGECWIYDDKYKVIRDGKPRQHKAIYMRVLNQEDWDHQYLVNYFHDTKQFNIFEKCGDSEYNYQYVEGKRHADLLEAFKRNRQFLDQLKDG